MFRYGWAHFNQHRLNIRHGHRTPTASSTGTDGSTKKHQGITSRIKSRRIKWAGAGIGRQIILGVIFFSVVILGLSLVGGAYRLFHARQEIASAQASAVQTLSNKQALFTPGGRAQLANRLVVLSQNIDNANSGLQKSWSLDVLKHIPFVSKEVSGLTQSVSDLDSVLIQGQLLLWKVNQAANSGGVNSINVPAVQAASSQFQSSEMVLSTLVRPDAGMWGPSKTVRDRLNKEIQQLVRTLHNGSRGMNFALDVLGANGPRTYFLAGLNNAEMRDQGMVLSYAVLHAANGHFTISPAQSVNGLALSKPAVPLTDPGTKTIFGPLLPTRLWPSVNAPGDFPTSARWMEAMYQQAGGTHVDGVIGIDVNALEFLLKATGPIRVSGISGVVNSGNASAILLHRLYVSTPPGGQNARRDEIAAVAGAAIQRFNTVKVDPLHFVTALSSATVNRHLLFYANNPAVESNIVGFHANGSLTSSGGNVVHVAIESGVKAKLGYYIHSSVTYNIRSGLDNTLYLATTITLHNSAPSHAKASYALGPDNVNTHITGEYIARIYEWLPSHASSPGSVLENGLSLNYSVLHVLPGQTASITMRSIIQNIHRNGAINLRFVPQGELYAATNTVNFTSPRNFGGPRTLTWVSAGTKSITWTTK